MSKKNSNIISEKSSSRRGRPPKKLIDDQPISEAAKTIQALESNHRQILELQNRILSAPAMNGGFSTLMYKVEKIEQSQTQIVEKVDEIRDVLYDPDSGLYARVKSVENSVVNPEKIEELEEEIQSIKHWKIIEQRNAEKDDTADADIHKMLTEHAEVIRELQRWYQRQAAVTKWLAVTVGTGFLGAFGKLMYEIIINHVRVV